MKKRISLLAVVATLMFATPAWSQIHFGVKAGLNVSKVSLDKSTLTDGDNRCGWFAGPMVEFTVPIVGLGVDAAVLYDNKSIEVANEVGTTEHQTLNYIDVPINLKYTIGLGSLASVYAATGPQFAFNVGGKSIFKTLTSTSDFELKKSEFSWNIGAGVKVLKHLQAGYNYNIALGSTADVTLKGVGVDAIKGKLKNNTHQISVAYMF